MSAERLSIPPPTAVLDVAAEDGALIRARRHGRIGGVRLFVSHGNGFAVDGYFPFWSRFLDRFEVVAFDMRNHGQNPTGDPAHHDYPHMARDLERVWRAVDAEFGPRPSAGLFHSMSAQAAMIAAIEIGPRFDALILFDPPNVPPPPDPAHDAMVAYLRRLVEWARGRRAQFDDPGELARDYAATRVARDWVPGAQQAMARAVLRPEPAGGWALRCPRDLEASMYAQGIPLGLWPRRAALAGPVKLIGGDPEMPRPSPTALANRSLAGAGGFDYAAIPGTGHLLQLEAPDACADAALQFLVGIGLK